MTVLLLYFLFSSFFGDALSAVHVVEPLDRQLPLIARLNEPFSWSFSERTFNSSDGTLTYTTSPLPSWLSFDSSTRTFSGTPVHHEDEGNPEVTVTAHGPSSSASSNLTLCVTHFPPPVLTIPISQQFTSSNRALSSVFPLSPGSALTTPNPSLRVPRTWSFSIGFQGKTMTSSTDIFYDARLADGTDIPDWLVFDPDAITLDGVVPPFPDSTSPQVFPLVLVGSDQEGYKALSLPFDIIVADHELWRSKDVLPTINVTAGTPFVVALLSPADFMGVYVDKMTIQPANISSLNINTEGYDWLRYDPPSRTLSGSPGSNLTDVRAVLPVNILTMFNQTIPATVAVHVVPSYFALPEFPALHLSPGDHFEFDLDQFYSNSTPGERGDADILVSYDPVQAANFIRFDSTSATLSGTIPDDFTPDHVTVSFTAYSRITHSTSHANLIVFISPSPGGRNGRIGHPTGLSVQAHTKLVLGLAITFGVVGGLCLLSALLAWFRRYARIEDTAMSGEHVRNAWTEKDRKWYGLDSGPEQQQYQRPSKPTRQDVYSQSEKGERNLGHLGLGLKRVAERSQSNHGSDFASDRLLSPGVMSKHEFMTKIKQTVRQVSNKYSKKPRAPSPRPVIGRPILLRPSTALDLNSHNNLSAGAYSFQGSPSNPFDDLNSQRASTFMTGSPSTSSAEQSIPRRRADFAPPRSMAQVHFEDGRLIRQVSSASMGSDRLDVASRQTASLRSGRSTSYLSHEYYPSEMAESVLPFARPRLVPFTSSTRVPVPRVSSLVVDPNEEAQNASNFAKNRIASQRAKIFKGGATPEEDGGGGGAVGQPEDGVKKSASSDELTMGLHYVQSLGVDQSGTEDAMKSTATTRTQEVTRYVVRTGEKFHIRIQVPITTKKLQVKQVSGQGLPKFLQADANGGKGMVEFNGTALSRDLGMSTIGIYAEKDCLAKMILEVIPRR